MLFSEPGQTPYDLRFEVWGFPVRVHPFFFLMPLLLGMGLIPMAQQVGMNAGVALLVLEAVFLLSILVHEMGHTLAFRRYGVPSRILLYWMGGLAIPGRADVWSQPSAARLTSGQQIVVSLAGPFAGFLLAGTLIGLVYLMGGTVTVDLETLIPTILPQFQGHPQFPGVGTNPALWLFFLVGIWANVFWNVLNLAPVFPLDGGQVVRELFVMFSGPQGIRNSLIVSIGAAVAVAFLGLARGDRFMGFFFLILAFSSFQALQMYSGGGGMWGGGGGRRPW